MMLCYLYVIANTYTIWNMFSSATEKHNVATGPLMEEGELIQLLTLFCSIKGRICLLLLSFAQFGLESVMLCFPP